MLRVGVAWVFLVGCGTSNRASPPPSPRVVVGPRAVAPPPTPTLAPPAATSAPEAVAPALDPLLAPAICWNNGDKHCSVKAIDDAVAARLALLPDRASYTLTLDEADDAGVTTLRRAPWITHLALRASTVTQPDALAALASLPSLTALDLGEMTVSPALWATVATLASLKSLELRAVDATTDFAPLSKLGSLERLSILSTPIKTIPDTKAWTSLTELHLEGNDQLKDFAPLSSMPKLRVLHLGHSKIASLAPVAKLGALEDLGIEFTPRRTLQPLRGLKALRHVLVPPEMPLFERAALKKARAEVVIEQWNPIGGSIVEDKGGCYLFVPGCCVCDGAPMPCPAKK